MKKSLSFLFAAFTLLLSACQPLAVVPVDLTEAQRLELEQQVTKYEEELKQVKQELKQIENQTPESTPPMPESEEEKTPTPTESDSTEPEKTSAEGSKVPNEIQQEMTQNEKEKTEENEKEGEAQNSEEPVNSTPLKAEESASEQATEESELEPEFVQTPTEKEFTLTVRLANAYQQLGQVGQAIKLYEDYLAEEKQSYAVYNNLGRLHEQLGQYDQAIAYYQRLTDEYGDKDYLRDIAKAYLGAKNVEKAEFTYNQWRVTKDDRDMGFERQLDQLKSSSEPSGA